MPGSSSRRAAGHAEKTKAFTTEGTESTEKGSGLGRSAGELYNAHVKPHPRIRKTVKWGGAVVSVLLVVVWIGSGWMTVSWHPSWRFYLTDGALTVFTVDADINDGDNRPGWHYFQRTLFKFPHTWLPARYPGAHVVVLPLWIPLVCALGTTAIAWRLDTLARRRANKHLCMKCSYDRTGLAAGAVCPECGAAAPVGSLPPAKDI